MSERREKVEAGPKKYSISTQNESIVNRPSKAPNGRQNVVVERKLEDGVASCACGSTC